MVEEFASWDRLNDLERIYIEELVGQNEIRPEEVPMFISVLLSPSTIDTKMSRLTTELAQYAITPRTAQHPKVKHGWNVLKDYFHERNLSDLPYLDPRP